MTEQLDLNNQHIVIKVSLSELELMTDSALKQESLLAVLNSPKDSQGGYTVGEINPRLFEVLTSNLELEKGHRYLVANPEEYSHIRHTMVFDQLCTMDVDMLLAYTFQDMDPDETKILLFGILQAPDHALSPYTKNRAISMLINFESMLRDFITDEQTDVSGVYKVTVEAPTTGNREDGPIINSKEFIITEAFMTEVEKEEVTKALHKQTTQEEAISQADSTKNGQAH
jgi:hypothetical protein